MKVCVSLTPSTLPSSSNSSSALESPPAKKFGQDFEETGVKKLFIVLLEKIPENYENVRSLFLALDLSCIPFTLACDCKMANIICGIQSHAATISSPGKLHHHSELLELSAIKQLPFKKP